ncbi:MAG: hypothetical protein IKR09_08165 [Alphaproteobacteria bacterium]|nr:hypothetical protein [Alphaproteobacteria bacterium]
MAGFIDSFFIKNRTAFFTFLIFGCICGAVFRYDLEWWDLINYHYYNAWAFLNDRLNVDVIPAFINTFFSPFIDLPAYFLTNALNNHPVIFSAIIAVPYGLLLFVTYKIAALFFSPDTEQGRIRIGLTLLLCICSVPVFMELSGTSHEHFISVFVLTALYFLLKQLAQKKPILFPFIISGFILGAAAGLKMTYAIYAAATGISLIVFYKQFDNPLKTILYFTLAGVAGFLASYGYWGWTLWKNFQSPVFPFFNSVFQSPYWEGADYKDIRYFDKSWLTVLFYPFYIVFKTGGDYPLHHRFLWSHLRLLVGTGLFILTFINAVRKKDDKKSKPTDFLIRFLMIWMTIAYIFWIIIFRVYRYMIPFELMLSVVLVHFFFKNQEIKSRQYVLFLVLFLTVCFIRGNISASYRLPFSKENILFSLHWFQNFTPTFLIKLFLSLSGATIFFLSLISGIKEHIIPPKNNDGKSSKHLYLTVIGYLLWMFSFQHDLLWLELIFSALLTLLVLKRQEIKACNKRQLFLFLFTAFCLLEAFSLPCFRPYNEKLLPVNAVPVPDNSLLIIKEEPASLFIPFLAHNATVRAVISPTLTGMVNGSTFHTSGFFAKKRDELIKEHEKTNRNIYYITKHSAASCSLLGEFRDNQIYYLCPLKETENLSFLINAPSSFLQ